MRLLKRLGAILLACTFPLFAALAQEIVFGQTDDFQDGTTRIWISAPGNLVNIDTGGPAGAGDRFVQISSNGGLGVGGKLTMFNLQQWLGNYVGQGVTAIEVDLRNTGTTTLNMRLAFKAQNLMNSPGYLSATPVALAPGSGWQHVTFSLAPASLVAVGGPSAYGTFFSTGIGDARIINEVGTTNLNGDLIVGQIGIDNIHAVLEPATTALLIGSGLILGAAIRRRR